MQIVKKKEELEEELLEKIQKLQSEKLHLQESMNILQRNQANLDLEKQKSAKSNKLLEKDIKTLEKVTIASLLLNRMLLMIMNL